MPKQKFKINTNDLVRVIQDDGKLGETLYLVDWVGERCQCTIREAGNPLAGSKEFDTSLLRNCNHER